jgi:hypothetical protein
MINLRGEGFSARREFDEENVLGVELDAAREVTDAPRLEIN